MRRRAGLRLAALAAAWLVASSAAAQGRQRAMLTGVGGQGALAQVLIDESDHWLYIELVADNLPPGRPFALHFTDGQPCPSMAGAPVAAHAIVPDVGDLRADDHGRIHRRLALPGLTLGPGKGSIVGFPVAIYATREDGGAMLACGPLAAFVDLVILSTPGVEPRPMPVPPHRSRADEEACVDMEDRTYALTKRGVADRAELAAATSTGQRSVLRERQAAHEAELESALQARARACGMDSISEDYRALMLRERAAAASAAK